MSFKSYNKKIEIKDLVGKNYNEYYKNVFDIFEEEGKVKIFNLPALVFTPYWFIYRKMIFKIKIKVIIIIIYSTSSA